MDATCETRFVRGDRQRPPLPLRRQNEPLDVQPHGPGAVGRLGGNRPDRRRLQSRPPYGQIDGTIHAPRGGNHTDNLIIDGTCGMSREIHADLVSALGHICIGWSYVEALQGHFLAWLLEAEQGRAFAITQNMSSSSVTDGIRALLQVPQVQSKGIGDLSELLSAISNTGSERNRLVHGIWSPGPEPATAEVQTVRWTRREVVQTELVTVADLNDLLRRVEDIIRKLLDLSRRLGFPA
jgi:hypothetical protein